MSEVVKLKSIEDFRKLLENEDGIIEAFVRNKNKKFKTFYKIILEKTPQEETKEALNKMMSLLQKNSNVVNKTFDVVNNIAKLNTISLVLNGLNLFTTAAGFVIVCKKLDALSEQIDEVIKQQKNTEAVHMDYKFKTIVSNYSNMLDSRKTQKYYSEEQMWKLVSQESDALDLLINVLTTDISSDKENLVFSILSLAQMLTVSLKYYDELYYYNNKDSIKSGSKWHSDHEKWVAKLDRLSSDEFIKCVQDCGLFEMDLNTFENDYFYKSVINEANSLKQDIEDNQELILSIDDYELFNAIKIEMNEETARDIENALKEAGCSPEDYKEEILAAVA